MLSLGKKAKIKQHFRFVFPFYFFLTLEKPDVTLALQEGASLQAFLCCGFVIPESVLIKSSECIPPDESSNTGAQRAQRLPFPLYRGHATSRGPGTCQLLPGKDLNGSYCTRHWKQQLRAGKRA